MGSSCSSHQREHRRRRGGGITMNSNAGDELISTHSSKRFAVVHETPDEAIASFFPLHETHVVDSQTGLMTPKTLARLATEALCRRLLSSLSSSSADDDAAILPGPLPLDVVQDITACLVEHGAWNARMLHALQNNELQILDLSTVRNAVTDRWMEGLSSAAHHDDTRDDGEMKVDERMDALPMNARVQQHPCVTLMHLNLTASQITDEGLWTMGPMPVLESLVLDQCHYLQGPGFSVVSQCPRLVTASMQDCRRLLDEAVVYLASSAPPLTELNLGGCRCLTDRALQAIGAGLSRHLSVLSLEACDLVSNAGLEQLQQLSLLRDLNLGWCPLVTERGLELLFSSSCGPSLERLRLARCLGLQEVDRWLPRLQQLQELDLNGCTELSGKTLGKALQLLPNLVNVDVSHCPGILRSGWQERIQHVQILNVAFSAVKETHLSKFSDLPALVELNLDSCQGLGDSGLAHLVRVVPTLERLNLADTAVTDIGMRYLATHLSDTMTHLNVFYCQISNRGLRFISQLRHLKVLNVDSRDISDIGLRYLQGLPLTSLDLFSSSVTDQGCENLASIKTLESLYICGGWVGDEGCEYLSNLTNLKQLNLSQNEGISNAGACFLRSLTRLECLNLSHTGVTAGVLRHLRSLPHLESLAVYHLAAQHRHQFETHLTQLRSLRIAGTPAEEGLIVTSPLSESTAFNEALYHQHDVDDNDNDGEFSDHDTPLELRYQV